jgi:hypothetical protein
LSKYAYTEAFTFKYAAKADIYTAAISGSLAVKPCGATIPSHMMNLMTDVGSYSVLAPKTGIIKLDAFPAPTNVNCTLTSHGITETSNTGGLVVTDGCTSTRKTECLEIRYPLD